MDAQQRHQEKAAIEQERKDLEQMRGLIFKLALDAQPASQEKDNGTTTE
jgi:hypothetical protein